jgi:pSer/pThr/pTyr-binding forkhead associated (FHA) protein
MPAGAYQPPPTLPPDAASRAPAPMPAGGPGTVTCPRCGTATPSNFAFCQQCGLNLQDKAPSQPHPAQGPGRGSGAQAPIDVQAATLATDGARNPSGPAPAVQRGPSSAMRAQQPAPQGPSWGTAVLVNRDGSDGQRFPLTGEYLTVGRTGADIEFSDDRFLARQHARFERANDGAVKVHPMDALNGVFRKADAPVELVDGTTILVGREVLRYERVDAEEAKVQPLVRHGVALFGSPPREPWGRLVAVIPSGGYRDVRHLIDKEIVLGREEGDIVFRDDAFMSRRHAAVTWDGKKAQVTDLGSSNGTFVRLTGPTAIKHGDHVRMGDQLLRIELGGR